MVILGAVCAAAILVFAGGGKWMDHWAEVRESLAAKRAALAPLKMSKAKRAGLTSIVPAFEMPANEETQKYLFRDKFSEQLKKAGINMKAKPLQVLPVSRVQKKTGYRVLRLKGGGKCNFGQVLGLLASLNENPYLVGIDEFEINGNPKKPQEFELNITVSTFVDKENGK